MTNPARRYRDFIAAQKKSQNEGSNTKNATAYELLLFKLKQDAESLRQVQSHQAKAEMKAKMIPTYLPWVNGLIESDSSAQDEILVTILVWMLDADQIEQALVLATHAIKHGYVTGIGFDRTLATLVADELIASSKRVELTPVQLETAINLLGNEDMPDIVKAKIYRAYGEALMRIEDKVLALVQFKRALEIDENSGVKQFITKLEKELAE